MNDREVTVTTSIKTISATNTVIDSSYNNAAAEHYKNAGDAAGILNAVGSYLFQYTAKDQKDQDATQVNFFLLVNDVEPPTCTTTCLVNLQNKNETALTGTGCLTANETELQACVTEVSDSCTDNSDGAVTFTSATVYTGDLDHKNLTAVVTITAHDGAGLYGRNGVNNEYKESFSFLVTDSTPPLLANVDTVVELECDLEGTSTADETAISNAAITCSDECSTVTPVLTVTPPYSFLTADKTGDVTIDLSCSDKYGNIVTEQQRFETRDTTDPVIAFNYSGSTVKFPITPADVENTDGTVTVGSASDHMTFHEDAKFSCGRRQNNNQSCHIDYLATADNAALRTMLTVTDDCCINDDYAITAVWENSDGTVPGYPATIVYNGTDSVDFKVVGKYSRTFTATDCSNNTATKTIVVELEDPNAPVVNPVGCNESSTLADCTSTVQASTTGTYVDEGAKCLDYVDGDLTARVEVSGDIVNLAVPNTYTISYSCTDYGSKEGTATRTVYVQDTTAPLLSFGLNQGNSFVVHEAGETYTDAGCHMSDSLDGDCDYGDVDAQGVSTCDIVRHGDTVNDNQAYFEKSSCASIYTSDSTSEDGMYVISPVVTTAANLKRQTVACAFTATSATAITAQIVKVDTAITLSAANSYCAENFATGATALQATSLTEPEMTALNLVLDTTNSVFVNSASARTDFVCQFKNGEVSTTDSQKQHHVSHVGVWVIKYVGTDKAGLTGTLHRTVMVKDTMPPMISLVGATDVAGYEQATSATTTHAGLVSALTGLESKRTNDGDALFVTPSLMAQTSANGYFMCAIASAVAGVALLGFSAKKSQTMVPV